MQTPQKSKPTTIEDWTRSDSYHNSFLIPRDEALESAAENNHKNGLPDIAVSKAQGSFLKLLVKSLCAKRVLEIGTLGGYSTICIAKALPADGQVITLELSEKHAQVAKENIANAGLADKVQIIVGQAVHSLATLQPDPPFDFVFIDADKPSNATYFTEAKRLVKQGGVIIVDNVVRWGRVADTECNDPLVNGVRMLLLMLENDKEVEATTISTVGEKGYDGFLYAVKN